MSGPDLTLAARLDALERVAGTDLLIAWALVRMPVMDAWREAWRTTSRIAHELKIDPASPEGEAFMRAAWRAAERAEQSANGGQG